MKDVQVIFQETLLGPKDFSKFHRDFWDGYKAIPDMPKELKHFAVNPFEPDQPLKLEMFIDFIIFDEKGVATIQKNIKVNKKGFMKMGDSGMLLNRSKRPRKYQFFYELMNIC